MSAPLWFWIAFNAFILLLLLLDLGVLTKRDRPIPVKEALYRSGAFFILAMIFAAGVFAFYGETPEERSRKGFEFLTGYLIEWSLSVDNIFVFVLIFSHFQVPAQVQHRVLFWGIVGALVMRGTLILVGSALINNFQWIMLLFGAFLIFSGYKMLKAVDAEPDLDNNRLLVWMKSKYRVTETYEKDHFFVRRDGVLFMTPLALVLILIETTDLVFALDSIPAIFAITSDPFIVYTANVFAILGLRAMYFALAGVIHRFHYLKYGLSIVLMVVGVKMIGNYIWKANGWGEKFLPVEVALGITAALIGGSIILSLVKTAEEGPMVRAKHAWQGWVPFSGGKKKQGDG
ncbi:TerC family protein [Elioraea sp.]|uniref:TerC family protein n=1 Tax=Elioraea sp. TaxID=2185103 RepID=UPI0025BC2894|nr:TerC family protein [Elioraea sp.]